MSLEFTQKNLCTRLENLADSATQRGEIFVIPDTQGLNQLHQYLELLLKWNKVMNLVGPYGWEEILDFLLVDSFHLAAFLNALPINSEPHTWDLGSGAGLPGIPLRTVWHNGHYTLVDTREKRVLFLRTVLAASNLQNTTAFLGRAEQFMQKQNPADLIISRAFMPWEKVLDLVHEHVLKQGLVVFLTLTPSPKNLTSAWKVVSEYTYETLQGSRFFWAIEKQ